MPLFDESGIGTITIGGKERTVRKPGLLLGYELIDLTLKRPVIAPYAAVALCSVLLKKKYSVGMLSLADFALNVSESLLADDETLHDDYTAAGTLILNDLFIARYGDKEVDDAAKK